MGPYRVSYTRRRVGNEEEEDEGESSSTEGTVEGGVLNLWGKGNVGDGNGFQE